MKRADTLIATFAAILVAFGFSGDIRAQTTPDPQTQIAVAVPPSTGSWERHEGTGWLHLPTRIVCPDRLDGDLTLRSIVEPHESGLDCRYGVPDPNGIGLRVWDIIRHVHIPPAFALDKSGGSETVPVMIDGAPNSLEISLSDPNRPNPVLSFSLDIGPCLGYWRDGALFRARNWRQDCRRDLDASGSLTYQEDLEPLRAAGIALMAAQAPLIAHLRDCSTRFVGELSGRAVSGRRPATRAETLWALANARFRRDLCPLGTVESLSSRPERGWLPNWVAVRHPDGTLVFLPAVEGNSAGMPTYVALPPRAGSNPMAGLVMEVAGSDVTVLGTASGPVTVEQAFALTQASMRAWGDRALQRVQ